MPVKATKAKPWDTESDAQNIKELDDENLLEARPSFIRKEKLKDSKGRKPSDPDYDPTTLYIPEYEWSSFSPSMQ